jgi:outer membrane protein assembly factor BamB
MALILATALAIAALLAQATSTPALSIDDVIGLWAGHVEHEGETAPVGVEFERRGDAVRTIIIIPAIHGRAGLGPATVKGNRIEAGEVAFDFDRAAQTLTTTLPDGFVPRYRLRVTLRRAASFTLPERPARTAPQRDPIWTADLGAPTWADAAFANGRVVIGAENGVVRAIDARTGQEIWQFTAGGAVRAPATFAGADVLVHSDDGFVVRLDGKTGTVRWRARVAEKPATRLTLGDPKGRYENRASGVAVAGGRLFVGTHEGRLVALGADRGERLWEYTAGDSIMTTPAVANGKVYIGSFDRHVHAVDALTGAMAWRYDTGDAMTSDVAIRGSQVIAGSRSYDLEALDAARGTPIWKNYFWFSWVESSPAIYQDAIYIGSSDAAKVFAIDAATGRSRWEADAGGSAWGRPAVTASTVFQGVAGVLRYIAAHRGSVSAFDRRTGALEWWYAAKPPEPPPAGVAAYGFAGSVAIGDGLVFAGALDGRLYAFRQ